MSCELIIQVAIAIASIFAVIFTLKAAQAASKSAKYSSESVREQREQRLNELRPVLVVESVKKLEVTEDQASILIFFQNTGRGAAAVLEVDEETKSVTANIGVPINVGPEGKTEVKICHKNEEKKTINLFLYYWDIEKNCFKTEIVMHLEYRPDNFSWFLDKDFSSSVIEKNGKLPSKVINCEGNFEKS